MNLSSVGRSSSCVELDGVLCLFVIGVGIYVGIFFGVVMVYEVEGVPVFLSRGSCSVCVAFNGIFTGEKCMRLILNDFFLSSGCTFVCVDDVFVMSDEVGFVSEFE